MSTTPTYRPKLPPTLYFGTHGRCFFELVRFGNPQRGEFFVSGAIPAAYEAAKDLQSPYWIVKPTFKAVPASSFVKGEPVTL